MNDVSMSLHTLSAQILTHDISAHERDTLLVDLAEATFVHQFTDGLQGWVTKCNMPCIIIKLQSCSGWVKCHSYYRNQDI